MKSRRHVESNAHSLQLSAVFVLPSSSVHYCHCDGKFDSSSFCSIVKNASLMEKSYPFYLHFDYQRCLMVYFVFVSVQFSHSVVSDSLWPHGTQHARPPCPLPTPRVHPTSCPLSQWCHLTISSSVVPFSSQHQGLFKWVTSLHQVAQVLEFQLQPQSFQWTLRTDLL